MRISDWSSDVCSSDLVPVTLPLDIAVGVSGSYSAIVDLVDPQVDLVAGSVPMAVLVADPLPMDGTPLHYRRPSPRPGNSLFHVEVPPGTTALTVQAKYSASQAFSIWIAQEIGRAEGREKGSKNVDKAGGGESEKK